MGKYIPLKLYFDEQLAVRLSQLIKPYDPHFPTDSFLFNVSREVQDKELKARVEVFADELKNHLPHDYKEALAILLHVLGPENETEEGMFTKGYFLMPVAFFVERYGLHHFDTSMQAMVEITKRHTSEYAIRPYLSLDIKRCLLYFDEWITDSNAHVRRLVSEGTRPRLPWAKRISPINNDPHHNLYLLENLLDDPSPYVQKSVSNHINDITKDYPDVAINWIKKCSQHKKMNSHVMKHGLRTLIKKKDMEAMKLMAMLEIY
ncbi:DNA alkylation repair protein [Salibacterium aidingense]|uniref:DNA alkylation repair protein n=1 Tax=Salibacterium aidingense TaxID=384933 RepID=UPI000417A94F|nr:DNA alkylation repair protein [Salibacterium aidingense]